MLMISKKRSCSRGQNTWHLPLTKSEGVVTGECRYWVGFSDQLLGFSGAAFHRFYLSSIYRVLFCIYRVF